MVKSSFGFHVIVILLLISLSLVTAKPGAKALAKSDPGHLVHDFYKCTSPVYRLRPECQQPTPQFGSGRIFSESRHFVEGGGGPNPQQAGQNNWPSYGSNAGEKKNERMVMPVEEEEEEESSTRRIQDEAQTTTSIVEANYTSGEKSTMKTVELADISHKEEASIWPSASYQTMVLTPSIAHLPLENQEVTLTQGHLPHVDFSNKGQDIGATQIHTSNVGELPLEINNDPESQDMLEQNPNISHHQPRSHLEMEVQEEEMNLPGTLPEKLFVEEEESPSVYDPIILMLQRP